MDDDDVVVHTVRYNTSVTDPVELHNWVPCTMLTDTFKFAIDVNCYDLDKKDKKLIDW